MTKKTVSSRILKRLEELLNTRELNNAPFMRNNIHNTNNNPLIDNNNISTENNNNPLNLNVKQPDEKLFLRRKKRLDYSNKYSEAVKERIYSGMGFGRWTYEEHKNFIEGIFNFGNKWKEIVKLIKTRNCIQARSHSQKFFFKLFKFTAIKDLEHYVNLKNLFSFGKEIGAEKLLMVKEFLIKAYDQIKNGENIDYLKNNLLVEFLKKLEKSKNSAASIAKKIPEADVNENDDVSKGKSRRRLRLRAKPRGKESADVCFFEICKVDKRKSENKASLNNMTKNACNNSKNEFANTKSINVSNNNKKLLADEAKEVFRIEKLLKEKLKKQASSKIDSSYACKSTNLLISEESTITTNLNDKVSSSPINRLECPNFSLIQNLGKNTF